MIPGFLLLLLELILLESIDSDWSWEETASEQLHNLLFDIFCLPTVFDKLNHVYSSDKPYQLISSYPSSPSTYFKLFL